MTPASLVWIVFGVCLALSFLFSGMEAGVFALSRIRIRQQMRAGRTTAKLLHGYLEDPEHFLWTIVVGNTLANFFILGWMIVLLHEVLHAQRVWFVASFAVSVFLFYALFDLLPKMLFRTYPNRLCLLMVRPFRFIHLGLQPLVRLVEAVSTILLRLTGGKSFKGHLFGNREELRFVMQESAEAFSSEKRTMINRVLDLQSVTVRQITSPLQQTVTAETKWSIRELLEQARAHHFSRVPVWETRDGQRRIAGLLSVSSLLFESNLDMSKPISDFLRPALYLDEDVRLEDALRRMQKGGQRLAIVLGRDRREIGIVTLEDILKALFGEVSL
jgi:CBS domain containing-hemolysin-like protein